MRRYRPFLIYSPRRGWAFYPNRAVTNLTTRNIGRVEGRRVMRQPVGWFVSAALAITFERASRL